MNAPRFQAFCDVAEHWSQINVMNWTSQLHQKYFLNPLIGSQPLRIVSAILELT